MAHLILRRLITEIESGTVTGILSLCLLQEAIGKTSPLLMSSQSIQTNQPTVSAIRSWISKIFGLLILLWSLINTCYSFFFRCPLETWLPVTMRRMWVCSVIHLIFYFPSWVIKTMWSFYWFGQCQGGEWFHYTCVGLTPETRFKGKWYCPTCRLLPQSH